MTRFRCWAWLPAAALLAGCVTTGESEVDAELIRRQGEKGVALASAGPTQAVFISKGQRVVVEPPDGYCLDEESISVNGSAAFTMVSECLSDHEAASRAGGDEREVVELALPRTFPGILTMSISSQPAVGNSPEALDDFEALLTSPQGQQMLGRGTGQTSGKVVATRQIGDALYVLVEGPGTAGGILSTRFWRAFAGINDLLVLATVSGLRDSEDADDAMLAFLVRQIRKLRRANVMPAVAEETQIVVAMADGEGVRAGAVIVMSESENAEASPGSAPAKAPQPVDRNRRTARAESTGTAPSAAPRAPAKPSRRS